jgi:PBSX family phage terminase large subunit
MPTGTVERLRHVYRPRGSAKQLFESRAPEILVSGSAGTGKSRGALEKVHLAMMKYPGARALILRKTASSLAGSGLQTWIKFVVKEALMSGEVTYFGGSTQEPPQYRYWNGSAVMIGGLDDPTKIMSTEFDLIFVQESTELTITDWEFANTRLRNGVMPYQQLLADANPNAPTHWLYVRCLRGNCSLLTSTHEENPRLFEECAPDDEGAREWDNAGTKIWLRMTDEGRAYLARLDRLTGVRYKRLRLGLWVAAEGIIYEGFTPALHVIKSFPIPESWPRYWAIDFGWHVFVCQFWAEDPSGRLIMYREIYRGQRTVDQHAFDIMAELSVPDPEWVAPVLGEDGKPFQLMAHHGRIWTEPKPVRIITDHDAEGRRTFERHIGLGTKYATKWVTEGIEQVQRRLRPLPDGSPNIAFMRDALVHRDEDLEGEGKPTSTVEEFPAYRWLKRGTSESPADKRPTDEPLKENDHGMDTTRYLVVDRDPIRRSGLRTVGA